MSIFWNKLTRWGNIVFQFCVHPFTSVVNEYHVITRVLLQITQYSLHFYQLITITTLIEIECNIKYF